MSNGYLVAASADVASAHEIAEGFGLDVVDAGAARDHNAAAAEFASAANVGLLISNAAAADANYVALLQVLVRRLARAQFILIDADARGAFAFLPAAWPAMSFADARTRADALMRQRQGQEPATQTEPPHAHPLPPEEQAKTEEEPPRPDEETNETTAEEFAPPSDAESETEVSEATPPEPVESEESAEELEGASDDSFGDAREDEILSGTELGAGEQQDEPVDAGAAVEEEVGEKYERDVAGATAPPSVEPPAPPASVAPPSEPIPASPAPAPIPPPKVAPPPRAEPPAVTPPPQRTERARVGATAATATAPADATAFAPKKLRRGTPELVRIVVHQPKDLNEVIKVARKIDPRAEPAPSGVSIGDVALGASIGVSLEVRGATTDGALQRRTWNGDPIDFSFAVEADASVKQVVLLARVFVDDAQIGVLAFTRNVSGPAQKPHSAGDRVRLKRHKRVFLSYSSKDRETVSQIATAYQMAGVEHFWDRASLKSGEEWHPRLRREIDRADLFHLCWSKAAADSEWVHKEAEHALTRRKKNSGKPDITVQMLDGPPWAPHPRDLDAINFDDFVRAAIVGYARGDGS